MPNKRLRRVLQHARKLADKPHVHTNLRTLCRKYGITEADYARMLAWQSSQCMICGRQPQRLCVDHDHATGAVRGLLCNSCNTALGMFEDDPGRMRLAAVYVERYRAK